MNPNLRRAAIAGVASVLPGKVLTNDDLSRMVDTNDEWIVTRTGIRERRVVDTETAASDLATEAARKALERAGVSAGELDLIIVATVTGDMPFPATACLVQANLGAEKAAAFDLSAACPGFLYALITGSQFISSGCYDTVLVIGVEVISKFIDWEDRTTCVLFGDAAGAAVLRPAGGDRGILSTVLGADGLASKLIHMPAGGSRLPASRETIGQRLHYLKMNGPEVYKMAVRVMAESAKSAMERAGLTTGDIDLVIPHQANLRIIEATAKRIGIPADKVFVNVHKYGNTSSATIPVAMDEACAEGRLTEDAVILIVSFGAGMVWAAAAVRWGS